MSDRLVVASAAGEKDKNPNPVAASTVIIAESTDAVVAVAAAAEQKQDPNPIVAEAATIVIVCHVTASAVVTAASSS